MRVLLLIGAILIGLWPGERALALPQWLGESGLVPAPSGFQSYCRRTPAACADPTGSPGVVRMSDAAIRQLEKYNQKWNSRIRYRPDGQAYGQSDYWVAAATTGDCEDIALAKRAALVAGGWPAAALWLAIGRDGEGTAHVVLVLRTDRGDLVLDNRLDRVLLWHQAALHWIARQVPGDSRHWRRLEVRS
ncbi:MAG: transglutaminase-like cysteine peptidase [Alphaproteobacteria bacterium]|nr:transglutaminase-like cysteine peptidase [Alphaproteobacteria bacterium]MCB9931358.1 transglutaminase-like cysteine peptidase [Alphaproteobacteria bacterium]